jgi:hypothetical protein
VSSRGANFSPATGPSSWSIARSEPRRVGQTGGGICGSSTCSTYTRRPSRPTELPHRRPPTWINDIERLHELLQTQGDVTLRVAFERGLAEQAIGAEYIAHYLGTPIAAAPFDDESQPSTIRAYAVPREGRVQSAGGAQRAERSGAPVRGRPRRHPLGASVPV